MAWTQARAFPTAAYYPLVDGYSWTYRVDGVDGYSRTILPGTFVVNGAATKAARALPDDAVTYVSNDASGIRTHATQYVIYVPDFGLANVRVVLSPALVQSAANATLGAGVTSAGTSGHHVGVLLRRALSRPHLGVNESGRDRLLILESIPGDSP